MDDKPVLELKAAIIDLIGVNLSLMRAIVALRNGRSDEADKAIEEALVRQEGVLAKVSVRG